MNKLENQNDWWRCQNYGRELYHHGIKGQKWGIRRYQNPDGTLTAAGRKRYYNDDGSLTIEGKAEYAKKNFLPTHKKLVANGKSIYEVNPAALNAIEGNRLADRQKSDARAAVKTLGASAATVGAAVVAGGILGNPGFAAAAIGGSLAMAAIEGGRTETNKLLDLYAQTRMEELALASR